MQAEQFHDGGDDDDHEQAVRPYVGFRAVGGVMGGEPSSCGLANGHQRTYFPVDEAVELKNGDDHDGVQPHDKRLDDVGIEQAVPGAEHHHCEKENAHSHLYESPVKAEQQEGRDRNP